MPPGTVTPSATSTSTSLYFPRTTVPSILNQLDSTDEVIDDTDLRIVYAGSWGLNLNDTSVPDKTSHSTIVRGSSLTVTFSGTGIDVLGFAHIGSTVIATTFVIDGNQTRATNGSVSGTGIGIADQTFFSMRGLENKQHTLHLVVGNGVGPRVFTVDRFVVTDAGSTSSLSASASGSALTSGTASTTALAGLNTSASPSSGQSLSSSTGTPLILNVSSTLSASSPSGSAVSSDVQLSASSGHHMSVGQVAGTVIGPLLGFALLVAFFLALLRWRAIRKRRISKLDTMPTPLFANHSENRVQAGIRNEKTRVDLEDLNPPEYEENDGSITVHEDDYTGFLYRRPG